MICFRNIQRTLFNSSVINGPSRAVALQKQKEDIQVVIIGAGLAGLSAANHLIKHGFNNTIIVEGTERYGGRVKSKHFGDTFCELGAKWVNVDATKDTVYDLLREARGLERNLKTNENKFYINRSGVKVSSRLCDLIDLLYKKLCSRIELEEKYKAGDLHDLNSVHTYFQAETNKILNSVFRGDDKNIACDVFNSLFKEFGGILGCCLEYVNIEHITKMQHVSNYSMYIPTGLDTVLNYVAKNIDPEHLRMGKPVGVINWYGVPESSLVGCIDGTSYPADHIICTLPLGVLKNFANYMFKPMLPKEKINAIKNLGYGNPLKIYLEYDKSIASWFRANIRPIWNDSGTDLMWTKQVVEISKIPTSNRVLEVSVGGAYYEEIEKLPEGELVCEITKMMRHFLKNSSIPYPSSLLRSDWSSLACYLGGRPYFSTASTVTDVVALARPLGESASLLFAGDATILTGFGGIDGARLSGIREAQRIIEHHRKRG